MCSKSTGEDPCQRAISITLQSNFIEIDLWHGCSLVNLLHSFRTAFSKNTSGGVASHNNAKKKNKGSKGALWNVVSSNLQRIQFNQKALLDTQLNIILRNTSGKILLENWAWFEYCKNCLYIPPSVVWIMNKWITLRNMSVLIFAKFKTKALISRAIWIFKVFCLF